MPFEIMDHGGVSTTPDFFQDASFPAERQIGFWMPKSMPGHHGRGTDGMVRIPGTKTVSSPLGKLLPIGSHPADCLEVQQSLLARDEKAKPQAGGEEVTANMSRTSWRHVEQYPSTRYNTNVQAQSFRVDGNGTGMSRIQNERSLFSSSLSETFSRKLTLSANDVLICQPAETVASNYEEVKPFESLKEIEAQTIGSLLPDEDDLFTGVFDKLGSTTRAIGSGDLEDFDLFSSGGGMELEGDDLSFPIQRNFNGFGVNSAIQGGGANGSNFSEGPNSEFPSRTLFIRNINSNVEDYELKLIFEQYGDIRTLYTACKHRGFVMISYHDIRAARNAMRALQNKPLRQRKLDIHYSLPKDNLSEKEVNQGILVVFNLDYSVSNDDLRRIFGVYGEIKEIRESPYKQHHKIIEYYDVRAAEAAHRAMNSFDIAGMQIKPEPSGPDSRRCLLPCSHDQKQDGTDLGHSPDGKSSSCMVCHGDGVVKSSCMESGSIHDLHSAMRVQAFIENGFSQGSCSVPNTLPSRMRVPSTNNQFGTVAGFAGQAGLQLAGGVDNRHICGISSNGNPVELSGAGFGSLGNRSCPLHGHQYGWNNSNPYQYHPSSPMKWQNLPSFTNGVHAHHQPQLHGYPRVPVSMMNAAPTMQFNHVGSAPAVNPSIWEKTNSYTGESHEASGIQLGSLSSAGFPGASPLNSLDLASQNVFSHVGGFELSTNAGLCSPQQMSHMFPGRNPVMSVPTYFDSPNDRVRFRKNEINSNYADRKHYELDLDRIMHGEDNRTTLMIKNIPNKYTSKMLLASIDEYCRGTYDFIYLPIDFKNKCNVGYAFINMTDALQIVPFYKAFNGKKWEKFNSEKVASLAYARIQGKSALIAHFQNSSLMNEDKRCRPILFHTDGPNAGDQEPFPLGTNIRSRPRKSQVFDSEENYQRGSPSTCANGEESFNGTDSSSGSEKD